MVDDLPKYVDINDPTCSNKEILTRPASVVTFPLTAEDKEMLQVLEKKFDLEKNCAGLAAPQLGFAKQAIIFALNNTNPELNARRNITDIMAKTIWLNPSYKPTKNAKKKIDYEGCFSVSGVVGKVARYDSILYEAYDINGNKVQGIAHDFLARIIQHLVDDIHGILYTKLVAKKNLLTMEEYQLQLAKGAATKDN